MMFNETYHELNLREYLLKIHDRHHNVVIISYTSNYSVVHDSYVLYVVYNSHSIVFITGRPNNHNTV